MPLAFITYALAFLDRQNYGYAESRLRGDLHLMPWVSSFVAGTFFLGYFTLDTGAAFASRRSLKRLVFWAPAPVGRAFGVAGHAPVFAVQATPIATRRPPVTRCR